MQQKQLIAIILVIAVVAAAAVGAVLLMKGGSSGDTKYTVTYNTNGGNEIAAKEFTKNTDTFDLTTPTKDGSTFLGWYLNADFSGDKITQVAKGTEKNITVYAKWQLNLANNTLPDAAVITANTDVKVTFDSGASDKTISNDILDELKAGKTLTIEDTVSKVSWTFDGAASKDIEYTAESLNTTVTVTETATQVNPQATLSFTHSGKLPYPSTVKYFFGTDFVGQNVTVKNGSTLEVLGPFTVDSEGYVEFEIDHCSPWTITVSYNVTFDANGGQIDGAGTKTIVVAHNDTVGELPVPSRTGYDVYAWDPVANANDVITAAKTYTAQWTANSYTVKYYKNAEDATGSVDDQPLQYGNLAALSSGAGLARQGYTLSGWNTATDGSGTAYDLAGNVSNLTAVNNGTFNLYAQWTVNQYPATAIIGETAIRSNVPAGWTNNNNGSFTKNFNYGTSADDIIADFGSNAENTTLTGHTFNGMAPSQPTLGTTEMGIYALWNPNAYTVRFNANGASGTMSDQAFVYGTSQNLTANAFTHNNAAFNGWATSATGTVVYADQAFVKDLTAENNAVIDLFAIWGPYNIVVNVTKDGAAYEGLAVTAKKDDAGNSLTLTYEGNGNYACRSGIELSSSYTVYVGTQNVGLVQTSAQGSGSSSVEYFTVTFDANGGVPVDEIVVALRGTTVEEPQDMFEKTGNSLTSWKKGNADWNFSTAITETTTLVAQWTPQTYTVTLNTNGGTINSGNVSQYTYGVAVDLPTDVTRDGCDFAGWYTNSQFSGDAVSAIAVGEFGNKEYFAKWNLVTYTITFNAQGGTPVDSITYTIETQTFDLPTNTSKTGNHLNGWYVSDPASSITQIVQGTHENMALKANWVANTYTVTFNKNYGAATGTMEPQNMTYGTSAYLTNNGFSNEGFAFGGWATTADGAKVYDNCQSVTNLTDVNEGNVNLYAVWEAYYIQVTVMVDNELDPSEINNMVARYNAQDIPLTRISTGVYKVSNGPNTPVGNNVYSIRIGNDEVTTVSVSDGVGIGRVIYNTVTFYTHCEIQVPAQKVLYGQCAQQPQMAERAGYDFDCWSQDSTQRVPFDFANTPIGAARVLDAFWNAQTYTVIYNSNGGTGSMNNGSATFGEGFTPAACTFTKTVQEVEYRFVCWNTAADGSGMVFRAGQGTNIDEEAIAHVQAGNLTLYAMWTDSTYAAVVGDTFTGTYSYTSPNPNMNFSNMPTRCVVISAGDEYRVEVLMQEQGNWYVMTVGTYDDGMWPVFGNLFDSAELVSVLSGQGIADQQTINGQTTAITKYNFTLEEGAVTGYLCTVDETGMICRVYIQMVVSEQNSQAMGMGEGTYAEDIVISGFTSGAAPETHSVTYLPNRYSEESDGTVRSCSTYLTPGELQFSDGDKVFEGWYYTDAMGDDRIKYVPGERVLTDRTVWANWVTPNTNICWDVTNLLDEMQILLNGTADAWPQDATLNDYLTFPGTSGWSAATENNTYNFTYNQHSYKMYILPEAIGGNGNVFQCATPSIVDGNLRLTFGQSNPDGKFYVTFSIYDAALPAFPGYNPHVGDTFTYRSGSYDYTYTVTKIPGSEGWAYTDMYQYSATVMGNTSNYSDAMYVYPVAAPTNGMYVVSQGVYDFNGQNVNCYIVSMKQITQASGQRATHTIVEDYVGIADGLPYSTMTDMGYGTTSYVLQSKSNVEAVTKHTVTFNGNGGKVDGKNTETLEVYGTNGINASREGYTFIGWATAPDAAVTYNDHALITSDCTLYAKWDFGGAHLATNGGNGTPSSPATLDLLNFSDSIKVYPHSFGYINGVQAGTTFTINGFMTVGETTVSPTFKYVTVVCINPGDINNNTMSQVASHVYVNTTMFNAYVSTSPEYIVLCVERNYTLTLDVGYDDKTDITYHANGGTGQDIQTVGPRHGAIVLKPSDTYSKENYRFLGWATSSNGIPMQSQGTPYETMPALAYGDIDNGASVDLYAIWEPYVHIIYDANGGTFEEPDYDYSKFVKADGETVYEISDGYFLHRNGFTLIGWSSDPNPVGEVMLKYVGGDKVTFPEEQTGTEMILYAYWAPSEDTFSVYYDKNANFIYMWHYPDQYDPLCLVPDVKMPIAQGSYEFANTPTAVLIGWNTAADGSGTAYGLTGYIQVKQKPQGDYVLYAMWKTTATVHFDANGGMGYMADQQATFGSNTQLTDNAFTKEGSTFAGWTIQGEDPGYHAFVSDIMGQYYLYVDTTYPEITLVANWLQQHTVTLIPNGGTFSEEFNTTHVVAHGATLEVPEITKEDFNFFGWVFEDNEVYNFATTPVTMNLTLNARWVYTVYYYQWDQGEEEWVENLELRNNEAVGEIAIPAIEARAHYSAVWNTAADGSGDDVEPDTMYSLTHEGGETALYEIYRPLHMTVILDPDGGEGDYEDLTFYYGQEHMYLNVDDPYKEGFEFTGWHCREGTFASSGENSDVVALYNDNITITLTAQYQAA